MENKPMKRGSAPLVIRDMQIETIMKYLQTHQNSNKQAGNQPTNQKTLIRPSADKNVEKFELLYMMWWCKMVQPIWKTDFYKVKHTFSK